MRFFSFKRRSSTNSVELGRTPAKRERAVPEDYLAPFPDDVWIHCILPLLSVKDALNMRLVSQAASKVATDEELWRLKTEQLPFFNERLVDRNQTWFANFARLHSVGEAGRYVLHANFPEPMVKGMGLVKRGLHWFRSEPAAAPVMDTVIGIMTAEKFINEMPRTPPQWIRAYTSVFDICGNRHSRASNMPVGCDWQVC